MRRSSSHDRAPPSHAESIGHEPSVCLGERISPNFVPTVFQIETRPFYRRRLNLCRLLIYVCDFSSDQAGHIHPHEVQHIQRRDRASAIRHTSPHTRSQPWPPQQTFTPSSLSTVSPPLYPPCQYLTNHPSSHRERPSLPPLQARRQSRPRRQHRQQMRLHASIRPTRKPLQVT